MKARPFFPQVVSFAIVVLLCSSGPRAWSQQAAEPPAQPQLGHRANPSAQARDTNPEGSDTIAKSTPMAIGKADRAFVTKAAANGLFEMQAAKLAASRSRDPAIKAFAETLLRDHAKAGDGLRGISLEHNYPLPDRPHKEQQALIDRLSSKHGAEFDSLFLRQVGLVAHEEDIKAFRRASRSTQTPDVKAWIERTLPTLEAHLRQAQDMDKR